MPDTGQNQVSMWQNEVLSRGQGRAIENNIIHLMYRAMQQAPPITGGRAPNVDAILGSIAPWIGRQFMGMQNPVFRPQTQPGFGLYSSWYASNITTPIMNVGAQQAAYQQNEGVMNTMADIFTNFGLPGAMGWEPDEMRDRMVNFAQNPRHASLIAQGISAVPGMEAIMGGNPMATAQRMLRARTLFGTRPGELVRPLDREAQLGMANSTMGLFSELNRAIYEDPETGRMGALPNMGFTRGFKTEDLGSMGAYMASRGVKAVRGGTPEQGREAVGQMARTLESLSEMVGSRDWHVLMGSLEKLTQHDWTQMSGPRLEDTFRRMSSTAQALQITPQAYMDMFQNMNQTVNASMGISPGMRAMGVNAGAFGGTDFTETMVNQVAGIALKQGVQTDPMAMQQIMARQVGLFNVGLRSPVGRDAVQMAYLKENADLPAGAMTGYEQALEQGNMGQAKTIAGKILEYSYGSAARGRAMMENPEMRAMILNNIRKPESAAWAGERIQEAQRGEYGYRRLQFARKDLDRSVNYIQQSTGNIAGRLGDDQQAQAEMSGIRQYAETSGNADMQQDIESTYGRVLHQTGSEKEAADAVKELINRSSAYEGHHGGFRRAWQDKVRDAKVAQAALPGTRRLAVIEAEMDEAMLRASSGQRKKIRELRKEGRAISDIPGTERAGAIEDWAESWEDIEQGLRSNARRMIGHAGERGGEDFDRQRDIARRRVTIEKAVQYRRNKVISEVIGREDRGRAIALLQDAGEPNIKNAQLLKRLSALEGLPPEERKRIRYSMLSGDDDTVQAEIKRQQQIIQQSEYGRMEMEAGIGIAGTGPAVANLNRSVPTFEALSVMGPESAKQEMNFLEKRINLLRNTPGVVVSALAGKGTMASVLGLEEGGLMGTLGMEGGGDIDLEGLNEVQLNTIRKSVGAITGTSADALKGDAALQRGIKELMAMDEKERQGLTGRKADALVNLLAIATTEGAEAKEKEQRTQELNVTGTIVLNDSKGAPIGQADTSWWDWSFLAR